jgi:hypothetical protein
MSFTSHKTTGAILFVESTTQCFANFLSHEGTLMLIFVSRRTPTYENETRRFAAHGDYTSTANWRALAPVKFWRVFGIFAVFEISYLFMPQLLAEPSLGNTGIKGNLFIRNRLNVYIRILTCSAPIGQELQRKKGRKEIKSADGRTDGLPCVQGIRKTKQRTE